MNKFCVNIVVIGCCLLLAACKQKPEQRLVYDKDLSYMVEHASENKQPFCVVLAGPGCGMCSNYLDQLNTNYSDLLQNAVFNIIDVSRPENRWYQQWLCSGAKPATCLFSPEGKLLAVIEGTAGNRMDCIREALDGKQECAKYTHNYRFTKPVGEDVVALLNEVLRFKTALDKGEDIRNEIERPAGLLDYPYPLYLKWKNEWLQGQEETAKATSERLLGDFNKVLYHHAYGDLFAEVILAMNPDYKDYGPTLETTAEICLDTCAMKRPVHFSVEVGNSGKEPLYLYDIGLSCSCLRLTDNKQHCIEPGETKKIRFEFTADHTGEIYREITIASNAVNSLKTVAVTAFAIEKQIVGSLTTKRAMYFSAKSCKAIFAVKKEEFEYMH